MSFFAPRHRVPGFHAGEDLQNTPAAVRIDGVRKRALETGRARLVATAAMFILAYGVIGLRMVDVAVLDRNPAKPHPLPQARTEGLTMDRADVVDRNGVVLATSLPTVSLYAKANEILDPVEATTKLRTVLPDLPMDELKTKLSSGRPFVYLRRNLTPRQQYDVNALGIPGLYFEKGERRVYPHGSLVAHIVGMTDIDNKGIAGIEKKFDAGLRKRPEPLRLALDIRMQTVVRNELAAAVQEFSAVGAMGMVMDVHTGEILASVSLPDFDPNDPPAGTSEALFNRATKGVYEMGSCFKLFNTALALETGIANVNSTFDARGTLKIGGFTIHDHDGENRWLTVAEILKYSSNIGSARMALAAGGVAQKALLARMGMMAPPPVELPEVGYPQSPNPWRDINTATIAFGHGMAVSPLQLITGTTALVNGGEFHPPTLLAMEDGQPVPSDRVVKKKTSDTLRNLMRMVVTEGTGKKADVPGYVVGGKTGTAEKASANGYRRKAVLSSFISAFPMDDPRYAVLVMIDEPHGTKETHGFITAGWTAAPYAGRIIAQIAPLAGIMPKPLDPQPDAKGVVHASGGREVAEAE